MQTGIRGFHTTALAAGAWALSLAAAAIAQTAAPAAPVAGQVAAPAADAATDAATGAATSTAQDAAAPVATAAPVAAVPLPKDARDRVVQVCMNEAKARGAAVGAADVSMREVKDTDLKSDGFASVVAEVNLVTKDSKGKIKSSKKKFECETRNDVITSFKLK